MRNWFRVVLPANGVFITSFVIYGVCYLPDLAFLYYGGRGAWLDSGLRDVRHLHGLVILLTALGYAVSRVLMFHPVFDKDYATWLRGTPWRYGLPLPQGPVHLVLQDLVIVGVLSRLGWWHLGPYWWAVPFVFLGTYLLMMISSFRRTGFRRQAYIITFGLGGTPWLLYSPWDMTVLLIGLYGVALHGLIQGLKEFENWDLTKLQSKEPRKNREGSKLGWPFDLLGPHREKSPTTTGWAAATAVLAGWWVFSIASVSPYEDFRSSIMFLVAAVGILLAVWRFGKYIWGYAPPISFRGRFATGQWIIPRYDVVFVAPILILLLVCSLKWLLLDLAVPVERALSAVTAGYVFVMLGFPPSLDEWRLTGSHRIVPAVSPQEMQQIP